MADLLISDLHLSPERPAIARAFFDFLEHRAAAADNLYILGDLVEAWIGDDDPSQLSRRIVAALAGRVKAGTGVYFLHGNRDFLVGKRFARKTGAILLGDYHVLETPHGRAVLCHGDTLCTDDLAYQKFRRKVRHPLYRWLLAHLPLRMRQRIARQWREKSRSANSNKPENIMDVNLHEVNAVMEFHGASILIHGHTHRPGIHDEIAGTRFVLGDWDRRGWFVSINDDGVNLESFPIPTE